MLFFLNETQRVKVFMARIGHYGSSRLEQFHEKVVSNQNLFKLTDAYYRNI